MLLLRYFVLVGGMLLGLLLLADRFFPASTAAATATDSEIDRSVIRIHSSHKWPNAVRMDTNAVMPAAAPATVEAALPSAPVERTRQAYAFEPPPQKAPRKLRRRAKAARPLSREHSQRFANYQAPDTRGWPPPGW